MEETRDARNIFLAGGSEEWKKLTTQVNIRKDGAMYIKIGEKTNENH